MHPVNLVSLAFLSLSIYLNFFQKENSQQVTIVRQEKATALQGTVIIDNADAYLQELKKDPSVAQKN